MRISWRDEWPALVLLAALFVAAAWSWGRLPERVPVHWNLAGQVDGYGGRFAGVLLIPLMTLGLYALMMVIPNVDPSRANDARFGAAYRVLRFGLVGFLAALYGAIQASLHGAVFSIFRVVLPLMGALFVLIGRVLGRLEPNWFIGVRTPWTLSSAYAWRETHRVAGPVFIAVGVFFVLAGLVGNVWGFGCAIAGLLAASLGLIVYSYHAWKRDPQKTPPPGMIAPGG